MKSTARCLVAGNGITTEMQGYCECGCGQHTTIAKKSNRVRGMVRGKPIRFVHGHNGRGHRNNRWKGGRYLHQDRYILVQSPNHPHADHRGYVREHILIAVRTLGKPLPPGTVIHHVDGNGSGNQNGNLVLCENQGYHMLLEYRTKAYRACGNANAKKCQFCKQWDLAKHMYISPARRTGIKVYHRSCHREYQRQRAWQKQQN